MIAMQDVSVVVGAFALQGIHFAVPAGGYAVLMGKTGSGKSTLLETLCGLRRPASGQVFLEERDVTDWKPAQRGLGYVPQDRALFQTMTVWENLAFSLQVRRWPVAEVVRRVEELAQLLGIGSLLQRKPQGLSGGEGQRVALGRALAFQPRVLLLDEPLAALDQDTKADMIDLLQTVRRQTSLTTLHVTHDPAEAVSLADQFLLLENGHINTMTAQEFQARQRAPRVPDAT